MQGESLGDLYQLLFSNRESLYRCMGTERNIQGCEQLIDLATNFHHPRVRPVDTCQDFHQRAFARAILAYQCMHFAREQTKVYSPQGLHTAKVFGNPTE